MPDGLHAGLKEGDKRKESAGHVPVEQYLQSEGLPYTIFQPLYIYGPHTGKVCGISTTQATLHCSNAVRLT